MKSNSQASQDRFILYILKNKTNGFFVEIGSNDPVNINNTYLLEQEFGWHGIMIEMDSKFLTSYREKRQNNIYIIQDATTIDYKALFNQYNVSENIDYLQIDLDVDGDNATLKTLQLFDKEILSSYKFAVITFEHDIYHSFDAVPTTRDISRQIFEKHGYYAVFTDVAIDGAPFEDWYVHPDLVDMEHVRELQYRNADKHTSHVTTGTKINHEDIEF